MSFLSSILNHIFQGANCQPDHESDIRHVCRFESADELSATVAQMKKIVGKVKPYVIPTVTSYILD